MQISKEKIEDKLYIGITSIHNQGVIVVRYEIVGREQYTKVVKSGGSSGIIYVPKRYVGHQVVVIIDGDIAISEGGGIVCSESVGAVSVAAEISGVPPSADDKELTKADNGLGLEYDNAGKVTTTLIRSDSEKADAELPLENFGKKVCPPTGDKNRKREPVTDTEEAEG